MTGLETASQQREASAPRTGGTASVRALLSSRRRLLVRVAAISFVVLCVIALLIPNEYKSDAQLMPIDQQSLSGSSMMSAMAGASALLPGGLATGLLGARTPGATSIGILTSRTVQDDIINEFDLRRVYHISKYVETRKKLADRTSVVEDKKSGIIAITVMDHDPRRARDIAAAYIRELDKLLTQLSTSSARQERVFLEGRLKVIKEDLDSSSLALSQFSSRNATLDYQKQGQVTVEAAAKLQGELISAESELRGLEATYTEDNIRVREVRARMDELQSQLRKIGGQGETDTGGDLGPNQLFPSIRQLPILGVTYVNLYRRFTMQETLYELLTKQYELAKVAEAKEIPTVKVLDPPNIPEKKSFPPRSVIVVLGTLFITFAVAAWIVGKSVWAGGIPGKAGRGFLETVFPVDPQLPQSPL